MHRAFCSTFFHLAADAGTSEISIPAVRPGVAVAYAPDDQADVEWIVIEDGPEPQYKLDEYPPSHRWCQDVMGKSPGDKIQVPGSQYSKQPATVKAIHSKYAYRLRDSFKQMTKSYADETGWAQIHTPKIDQKHLPPETTLKPLLDYLELAAQQELLAFESYRTHHLPVHAFGALLGRSTFKASFALMQRDGFGLYCWGGIPAADEAAQWLTAKPLEIVLDLTAIATLFALNKLSLLQSREIKFIVSQNMVEELRSAVRSSCPDPRQVGSMGSAGRQLLLVESTAENAQRQHAAMLRLLEMITTHCEVRGGRSLAYIEPAKRTLMCKLFGQHGAESLILAQDGNCLLWTDDAIIALYGKHELGIRRLWTQAVLESPLAALDEQARLETTAKLVGWGYHRTFFGFAVMKYACELSEWQPHTFPLKQIIAALAEEGSNLEQCVQAVSTLIVETERAIIVNPAAQATYHTILTNLRRRRGGESEVKKMLANLPLVTRESMNRAGSLLLGEEL